MSGPVNVARRPAGATAASITCPYDTASFSWFALAIPKVVDNLLLEQLWFVEPRSRSPRARQGFYVIHR